ncbi:TPA: type I glutamate--ammonia ligase [Candidatus Micrarchaeota archaeon]|nr:type I glutamate--ammonia ligase [Candidatus Micrarchaeota archaeon]HIH30446.1 type I glutamate--ammonia ligase [Candidatus Micrarchaeota archaeon]
MLGGITGEEITRVLADAKEKGVEFVDLEFVDIMGTPKMCEITTDRLEDALESGTWFDGSSIEGFARIAESDMFLVPDTSTWAPLPWTQNKTARIICDVYSDEKTPFAGDPRQILKRQLARAEKMGFDYKVGPELEFFIFKGMNGSGEPEAAQVHDSAGYFDLATRDEAVELRQEIVPALEKMGMRIERSHHEVAQGQHEIDFTYGNALPIADAVLTYRTTVKTLSKKYGLYASFMPKPVYGINGSGMHVHQSLWKGNSNLFYDASNEYCLSKTAMHFLAGIMEHARALAAITNPTVNSYKRLVPGYEAPVYICWGRINRSALIRIPRNLGGREKGTRIECRFPDPSCNPYLAFAAMLAAGLDGIERKLEPSKPVEERVYGYEAEKRQALGIKTLPETLEDATNEFLADKLLTDAMGQHTVEYLVKIQRNDWNGYKTQVTPWEKERYFGVL